MTAFDPDNLGLTAAGLPLLRDLVHERTGLFYENGRCDVLGERLSPLVIDQGFHSFLDYYYLLKYEESGPEWRRVLDALAVQETYFWREQDQILAFVRHLMPKLASTRRLAPIRIWTAPCATGEEALTIAMALNEGGWFDREPIEIYASDGSMAAIARARAGRYRGRAFRTLPVELQEKYFRQEGDAWVPVPALAEKIRSWSVVNLMNRLEIEPFARSNAIFCRNAFIYFSQASIRSVVASFADLMPSPGYLFVGASESLLNATDRFVLEPINGAFMYVKR